MWVTLAVVGAVVLQRRRATTWPWWGPPVFASGWVLAVATVLSSLDGAAEEGSLSAHVAQHVILGDLAAPLLLIGLPPAVKLVGSRWHHRATAGGGWRARFVRLALSPAGGLVLWAAATYAWVSPPVHRLAIPDGLVHLLDHTSFLVFGLLVWLAAFDFRQGIRVRDWESLKATITSCGLPWWARHVYAMASRLAMLPAVAILWLASTPAYYLSADQPPGNATQREDQVQAASMMLGFEILLSGLAIVLAFVWVSVSEGRAREARRPR